MIRKERLAILLLYDALLRASGPELTERERDLITGKALSDIRDLTGFRVSSETDEEAHVVFCLTCEVPPDELFKAYAAIENGRELWTQRHGPGAEVRMLEKLSHLADKANQMP